MAHLALLQVCKISSEHKEMVDNFEGTWPIWVCSCSNIIDATSKNTKAKNKKKEIIVYIVTSSRYVA